MDGREGKGKMGRGCERKRVENRTGGEEKWNRGEGGGEGGVACNYVIAQICMPLRLLRHVTIIFIPGSIDILREGGRGEGARGKIEGEGYGIPGGMREGKERGREGDVERRGKGQKEWKWKV